MHSRWFNLERLTHQRQRVRNSHREVISSPGLAAKLGDQPAVVIRRAHSQACERNWVAYIRRPLRTADWQLKLCTFFYEANVLLGMPQQAFPIRSIPFGPCCQRSAAPRGSDGGL